MSQAAQVAGPIRILASYRQGYRHQPHHGLNTIYPGRNESTLMLETALDTDGPFILFQLYEDKSVASPTVYPYSMTDLIILLEGITRDILEDYIGGFASLLRGKMNQHGVKPAGEELRFTITFMVSYDAYFSRTTSGQVFTQAPLVTGNNLPGDLRHQLELPRNPDGMEFEVVGPAIERWVNAPER